MTTATIQNDRYAGLRRAMVASQLRTNAVSDLRVVAAMDAVPRQAFAPEGSGELAYRDTALPLAGGRALNVPIATGRLLSEAALQPGDHVLLVGAATGYTAAVLAGLVADVVALEEDAALVQVARAALTSWPNVAVVVGALAAGAADSAPYDVVVIDGAVESVPEIIWQQLKPGGRLVTGLVDRGVTRLAVGRRSAGGNGLTDFADVDCVILPGFSAPRRFSF